MKNAHYSILLRAVFAALIGLALAAVHASAVIVASDTFSITDSRLAGSYVFKPTWTTAPTAPVRGSTETGNLIYNSNITQDGRGWILAGDAENGYVTRTGSSAAASLALPFNFNTYAQYGDVATWELRIKSQKPSSGDYSFRISFYTSGDVTAGNVSNALISLYINPLTDVWSLRSGNTTLQTKDGSPMSGTLSSALGGTYSSSAFYTYSISYNNKTQTVTNVSINGNSVVSNYVFETSPGNIGNVGFFGQWTNSNTQIDSLTLSVNPAVVPEPATVAMLTGGFLLLLLPALLHFRKHE